MKKKLVATNPLNKKEVILELEDEISDLKETIENERKKHKNTKDCLCITGTIAGFELMALAVCLGYIGFDIVTTIIREL